MRLIPASFAAHLVAGHNAAGVQFGLLRHAGHIFGLGLRALSIQIASALLH